MLNGNKPRLLILTPRLPYPPIGGDRLRIYQLCKHLANDFRLSLLSMCESREEYLSPTAQDGIFTSVDRVLHGRWKRLAGCLRALPSSMPFQVGYYQNQEFATKLQELLPAHDGVLAHLIRTGSYLSDCKLPKVLEMTDAISLTYSRGSRLTQNGIVSALAYRWEARRLIRYERSIVDHFDLSILVSRVDRDFLLRPDSSASVYVCPNGVDASALPFQYRPDGATIIFIGNNTALHNVDGILYFVEEILPRVRSRNPRAQFKVIGRISDRLRRRLQREAKVIVTGSVQSVADEARSASVAVCPIRFGAGVQNKLLEYLSLGIPAVTSAIGQEGLAARDQVHLLLAETQDEWVDRVCELLQNPERGCALAHAGRALVEGEYSWSKLVEPLRRRIFDLVDSRFGKTSAKSILEHTTPSI